jgi:hypothetical protein
MFSKIEGCYDTQLQLNCVVRWPLFRVTEFSHHIFAAQKSAVFCLKWMRSMVLSVAHSYQEVLKLLQI